MKKKLLQTTTLRIEMKDIFKAFREKAENDYRNGTRVTIDDCIQVTLDSMRINQEGLKKTPLKKHFKGEIEIDKILLNGLLTIKNTKK